MLFVTKRNLVTQSRLCLYVVFMKNIKGRTGKWMKMR